MLVSGAGRGIGAACARRFALAGARVALLARSADELDAVATSTGGLSVICDVSDPAAVTAAVERVRDRLGPIEILINNAGVVARHPVVGHPIDVWRRVIDTNLGGAFLLARAVLPDMLAAGRGRIVNVSSVSGRVGTPELAAYCASKWGLVGFTKALAEEVKGAGVVVTAICPGSVATRMLDGSGFDPAMSADDVAAAIELLTLAPAAIAGAALDMFG